MTPRASIPESHRNLKAGQKLRSTTDKEYYEFVEYIDDPDYDAFVWSERTLRIAVQNIAEFEIVISAGIHFYDAGQH